MRISEDRIRRIIRREIVLETMRRFRASLVPGEWDPELGDEEEQAALEKKYFGKDADALAALASDLPQAMFGHPLPHELKKVGIKHGVKVAFLGRGAYRAAFSIGDDLVIKVINDAGIGAEEMNKADYRLGTDSEIGQIAPRAYVHGDNFSWVVLERVAEITEERKIIRFFKSSFALNPESLTESQVWTYFNLLRDAFYEKNKRDFDTPTVDKLSLELTKTSPLFRNFKRAIKKYNIVRYELRPDNFGIGSDGRLVLLDSSIF
jgi:hypothetical protein